MKAALISVLGKEDVLMPRVSAWLVGQVTAVNSVGNVKLVIVCITANWKAGKTFHSRHY